MRCPYCDASLPEGAAYCLECGAAQAPSREEDREPAPAAILRRCLTSRLFLVMAGLLAAGGLFQILLVLLGQRPLISFTVNGQVSPLGSLILILILLAPMVWALWKTWSTARAGAPTRIAPQGLVLGKALAMILLILYVLGGGFLMTFLISLSTQGAEGSQEILEEMTAQLRTAIPDLTPAGLLRWLTLAVGVLAGGILLEAVFAVSLLRVSAAARNIAREGVYAKVSRFAAVGLLVNCALITLSAVTGLGSSPLSGLSQLFLAGGLLCGGLLTLRLRRDLDRDRAERAGAAD